ncbi:hypothetical protein AB1I68_00320 [Paenibacillus pabuli]|uniref:hypothetical protein n=1 Tax=Paenibacillus pabuli TaxID=1472 RepID=UPI0034597D2A
MKNRLKGRIVNIEKTVHQVTHLLTGIKKKDQTKYRHRPGSNGTVVTGSEYSGTTIDIKIFVYDYKECIQFDIRDYVLRVNDKKKISSKLLGHIISANEGQKVVVEEVKEGWRFDFNQLDVIPPKKTSKTKYK